MTREQTENRKAAIKLIIEHSKIIFNEDSVEGIFDLACLDAKKPFSEAWSAFVEWEQTGLCPDWVYDFMLNAAVAHAK